MAIEKSDKEVRLNSTIQTLVREIYLSNPPWYYVKQKSFKSSPV